MMYFLVRPDGKKIPIIILAQDGKSLKISNFDGIERWIPYTEFVMHENLVIMK